MLGQHIQAVEVQAPSLRGAEARDPQDLQDLGSDADGRHEPPVAPDLVDPEGREHLLETLLEALQQAPRRGLGLGRSVHGLLDHRIRAHGVGPHADGHHDVVHVADADGLQDHAHAAPQRHAVLVELLAQRLIHRGDSQVGVADPLLGRRQAILEHEDLRPGAHGVDRGLAQARNVLARGVIRREVEGEARVAVGPCRLDILHDRHALAGGHPPELRQAHLHARAHGTQDDRHAQFAALRRLGLHALDRRATAQHHARGEVLHLALAVDCGVGDHGHRLLQVVRDRERHGGQRAERAVPPQRSDGLGAAVGMELHLLLVAVDPARRGEEVGEGRLGHLGRGRAPVAAHGLEAACEPGAGLAVGQAAARTRAGVDLALHLGVGEHPGCPALAGDERHLLAGGERTRIGGQLMHRDDPRLGRRHVHVRGLHPPQRPEAEGIHREHHLVIGARGERHRPLGVGPPGLAVVHVQVLQVGRQPVHLTEDRRERELDGLHEREPLLEDEALEQPVQVLRVRSVPRDGEPQLAALLAQLRDGVDLAVVTEDGERLHAAEGGVGVGGVPVVGDDPRRSEGGLGELGVEGRQHHRLAQHLVHAVIRRERGHVAGEVLLDGHHRPVALAGGRAGVPGKERQLPEDRRILRGAGPEGRAVGFALAADEDLQPVEARDVDEARQFRVGLGGALEEDVRDHEPRVLGKRGVQPGLGQSRGPERTGDVHLEAGAVALSVHAAGAVHHHVEAEQRALDDVVAGEAVPGGEGRECAGVMLPELGQAGGRGRRERRRRRRQVRPLRWSGDCRRGTGRRPAGG